jgi:hypothetical protein
MHHTPMEEHDDASELLLIGQPVEKVAIELIATTNRARKAPRPACLVPDLG